jgi:hypothetical protein
LRAQPATAVGVVGLPGIYPFLGPAYANQVDYIGRYLPDHSFVDYATCGAWRSAVEAGHYAYVAIETSPGSPPPQALGWTQTDGAARPVLANSAGSVFAIEAGFDQACGAAGA